MSIGKATAQECLDNLTRMGVLLDGVEARLDAVMKVRELQKLLASYVLPSECMYFDRERVEQHIQEYMDTKHLIPICDEQG